MVLCFIEERVKIKNLAVVLRMLLMEFKKWYLGFSMGKRMIYMLECMVEMEGKSMMDIW